MSDVSAAEGVPRAGVVVSVTVSLTSISIISIFLTQKYAAVKSWRILPCAMWLVIGVYVVSYFFVFFTAVLKYGLGLNTTSVCDGAIYLCLVAYITSKLIYMFLVEKAYIIRGGLVPRLRSKLWCFNTFGMLGGYAVVIVLNFVYRISRLDENGHCVIGMERRALLPLILFDLVLNVYLTSLFLIPLFSLYSFQNKEWTRPTTKLHKMAVRTFIGSLATLTSVIVNLSVLTALNGEPGWVCLLCCNTDVLWSAIMIHWVTYHDHIGSRTHNGAGSPDNDSRSAKNVNGLHSNASSRHTHHQHNLARCPYSAYTSTRMFFSRHHSHNRHHRDDDDMDAVADVDVAEIQSMYAAHHNQYNYNHHPYDHELYDVERRIGAGRQRKRNSRFTEVALSPSEPAVVSQQHQHSTHLRTQRASSGAAAESTTASSPVFITSPQWVISDSDDSSHIYHTHTTNNSIDDEERPPLISPAIPAPTNPPAATQSPTAIIVDDRMSRYSNVISTDGRNRPSHESPRPLPLVCRRTGMSPGI